MALQLSYFAWVRETMAVDAEGVDLPSGVCTIADLAGWLAARDARGAAAFADLSRIRAARDNQMVPLDTLIGDARDIALFPPVTGG